MCVCVCVCVCECVGGAYAEWQGPACAGPLMRGWVFCGVCACVCACVCVAVQVGKANLFVNSELPQRFPDQFAPLRLFGFDPARRPAL